MRKIRKVLRQRWEWGMSEKLVAACCLLAKNTVAKYVKRAVEAGLSWPLPEEMTDEELERCLFHISLADETGSRFIPEWSEVHRQLARKGVSLQLVWEEYKEAHPDGLQYTQFCVRYREWRETLDLPMRQEHKAGEILFVAVLGASNYTYVEACWTQGLPEWIMANVHAFQFIGGVPALTISDNLKAGVAAAHRYEPEVNRTYEDYVMFVVMLSSLKPVCAFPGRSAC